MKRVDKITGFLIGVAMLGVFVLAGMDKIEGNVALGFVGGITTAFVSRTVAKGTDKKITQVETTRSEP